MITLRISLRTRDTLTSYKTSFLHIEESFFYLWAIGGTRLKAQDTRHKTQDTRHKTQDSRLKA